jgi:pyridoxal phosphate enzyme (YggS family)
MSVSENISRIREQIAAAARRAGHRPEEISLMAVSKTFAPELIREAYGAGQRLFGESRVQEFAAKAGSLRGLRDAEWHMIGHLQGNKAAKAADLFVAVDSVDSLRLARKLNEAARVRSKKLAVLIEVNLGEDAKSGVDAESQDLEDILQAAPQLDSLEIRGLMAIPPFTDDAESSRSFFRELRELREEICARRLPRVNMDVLSMGMSHDFEVAIEEGSTCVRIGTAIFGERLE